MVYSQFLQHFPVKRTVQEQKKLRLFIPNLQFSFDFLANRMVSFHFLNNFFISPGNALQGNSTYIHCKAGRGRSTTVVLCYLVWQKCNDSVFFFVFTFTYCNLLTECNMQIRYKKMTPKAAWAHIKSIRSRVCLTKSQWEVCNLI